MKKVFHLVLLTVAVFAGSCKKDSLSRNSASNNPIVGLWQISSFVDNGLDKTSQFAAYTFTFTSNNNLEIRGGSMMSMCSWTHTDSVYHFNMMGMHSNSLDALDDDWILMNFSNSSCTFVGDHHDRAFAMHRK